jgi:serine phosphatase RsbU (regulator of sigma subunit)/CHASE2 domain-containing sensor protein
MADDATPPAAPAGAEGAPPHWSDRRWLRAARGRRGRPLGLVLLVLLLAALLGPEVEPLRRLRLAGFDACQWWLPRVRVSEPAVIVDIDESSLARHGQWPWPRTVFARLLATVAAAGPAAIGIDLLMQEPDRLSPDQLAAAVAGVDPGLAERLARMPRNDDVLADTIRHLPVVLGVAGLDDVEPTATVLGLRAPPVRSVGGDPRLFVKRFVAGLRSLDRIDAAAAGHGLLTVNPEAGVVRRIPLMAAIGPTLMPTLGLEMLRVASGTPALSARVGAWGLEAVGVGDVLVPTQPDGSVFIHYARRDPSRFVSAADVLGGRTESARFARKLVLVGITAVGLSDFTATPVAERMFGVEIHAQLIEGIFDGDVLARPRWVRWAEAALLAAGGILLLGAVPALSVRASMALLVAVIGIPVALALFFYLKLRILFDASGPSVALAALFTAMLGVTLAEAESQRRALRGQIERQREAAARLAGELEAARRIQMGILPSPATAFPGGTCIELYAFLEPAREVGGDLYDFFRLDRERIFFLIGDVSGKGLPGSLFMALSKSLCKSIALRGGRDLGVTLREADREISRDNGEGMFVTVWAGVLDERTGVLAYCGAGHDAPYLLRRSAASLDRLAGGGGPPFCVVDAFPYEAESYQMQRGDTLCLFTDGVTEAKNVTGELYGRARLETVLAGLAPTASVEAVGEAIRGDVARFAAGVAPADDLAILVLRWIGPPAAMSENSG